MTSQEQEASLGNPLFLPENVDSNAVPVVDESSVPHEEVEALNDIGAIQSIDNPDVDLREAAKETNNIVDVSEHKEGWFKRNLTKLSIGALVVGTAVTLKLNPYHKTLSELRHSAPWVVTGLLGSEIAWNAGAALMLIGAGLKIGNPFKLRSRMSEIGRDALNNTLFKTGLAVNTIAAVGAAGIIAAGVTTSLPPETWPGGLALVAADLASTVAIRAGIYKGMRKPAGDSTDQIEVSNE